MKISSTLIITTIMLLLLGCQNIDYEQKYKQNIDEFVSYKEQIKKDNNLQAPFLSYAPSKCFEASIYTKDLPIAYLPILLTKAYGVEINMSQSSNLKISINYSNICLKDLIEEITELYNIGFSPSTSGYNIHVDAMRTQFFNLNYHVFSRSSSSATVVQGNGPNSSASNSNTSSTSTDTSSSSSTPAPNMAGYVNINTSMNDNLWTSITEIVNKIASTGLPDGQQASISINQETGTLIVTSYPKNLLSIQKLVDKVNRESQRQVTIEAKLLELKLSNSFVSGIDWSMFAKSFQMISNANFPVDETTTSTFVINARGKNYFDATIQALARQGKLSVLSSPRVSVLNNNRAIIKFGTDAYYITNVSSNIESSGGSGGNVANSSVSLTTIFSGIALDSSASITDYGKVLLHIHPTITNVTEANKEVTVSGQKSSIPLPVISTREADTVVSVNSGDMIIIGGLVQNSVTENESGIGGSPLLKKLFKPFATRDNSHQRSELVILIRPVITQPSTTAIVEHLDDTLKGIIYNDHFKEY